MSYSASARVFDKQIPDAGFVVHDEDARARRARWRSDGGRGLLDRRARAGAHPLAVEPRVDVALAKAPLAADPDRRNLARLDQAVHGAKVDLEVLEDFFGGEKRFINHHWRLETAAPGNSTVKTAPPSR